ncbi:tripartite motif-containing protein 60-like [Suricata suricatta]|uniref:Tripartite motif containing 61 n=1 Tax=Suricata suricatta TaxID=37032 RepID=A0A673TXX8_SURSU|nr:tripartite motif-containing protein 60-like [Suricata suricatta]
MEFAAALEDLQTGASCPICLDYLKDPVTINCGHNFCLSCISESWKDLRDNFPCPFCLHCSPERKFTSNPQLSNLIEIAKQLQVRRSKRKREEEKLMCEKHNQVLTFFCEKDLEVLCPRCCFSADHQTHYIWSIEKAVPHHRRRLENCTEAWKERIENSEKVIAMQTRKSLELKKRVEYRREEIKSEFEQLLFFLKNEQETILRELQDEEEGILMKLKENLTTFSDHLSTLKYLLKEIEGKRMQTELELLTDVKDIYHIYKTLQSPALYSFQLREYGYHLPPQYSGLNKIIKQFQVDVKLDPDTAHRKLVISEDRKTVQYGKKIHNLPPNPRKFFLYPAVLASCGYDAGRQYWEVEVKDNPLWIVGVCKDSIPRRRRHHNQPMLVQDGLWGVGRCTPSTYIALGPKKVYLMPKTIPRKIGVFLDWELCEISFYNLSDRSLLYSFSCYFTEKLWPYFYTVSNSVPLKLCAVTDSE